MGLDARIYIPHLSCRVDKPFFVKITNCVDFLAVAYVLRSEAPQLLLFLLNCLLALPDEFHVHYHHFVIFLLLHVRLAFLLCLQFEILFYFPLWARRYRLGRVGFLC